MPRECDWAIPLILPLLEIDLGFEPLDKHINQINYKKKNVIISEFVDTNLIAKRLLSLSFGVSSELDKFE